MPLDGFRLVDWASRTFGGLPITVLGGFGVAVLVGGIILAVMGVRAVPTSYGFVAAGLAFCVLAYFIVGSVITSAHAFVGDDQVGSSAVRIVPFAASTACFGLLVGLIREALRNWALGDGGNRGLAVLLVAAALGLGFLGVQIVRGSAGLSTARSGGTDALPSDDGGDDAPVRHGVTGSHRR